MILGNYLKALLNEFVFTPENIYKIKKFIGNRGSKITPNYFGNLCGTTGLFIFLIKDALEYSGITSEKKTQLALIYSNLNHSKNLNKSYLEKMKKVQELMVKEN